MEIYNDNIEQRPAVLRFGWGISWSAVLAGFFLSLVIYLVLTVLGTAIGASAVDPLGDRNPLAGAGLGVGIWLAVTTLVSLFVGAFISGRSAPRQGALHGLLTWALMTVAGTWLLAALASGVTGTTANMVGNGLSLAGRSVSAAAAAAAPGIASGVKDQLQQKGIEFNWNGMQDELNGLLRDSGKPGLQPGQLKANAKDAASDASHTAQQAVTTPQAANDDLAQWFARVKQKALPALDAADKDALVNIVAARSGKSHQEAQKIVDGYAQAYDAALARYQQLKAQAEQQAREAAASAAKGISKAAWSSLAILLIGALVASFGGWFGLRLRPRVA